MSTIIDAESYPSDELDVEPPRRWYDRISRALPEIGNKVVILGGIVAFVLIYFAPDIFISVRSGEAGVLFLRFAGGTQTDRVLGEGIKVIPPWDKLFVYNVRVQETKHTVEVLTNEGLKVKAELSIRFHPELDLLGLLHKRVGPDYRDKVVIPEVESALRIAMSTLMVEEVYGSQRALVQQVINDSSDRIAQKYIHLDQIVLRELTMPDLVRNAIDTKMTQKELAKSYEFQIEVAHQEAERRRVEANGLKTYQDILGQSLTPNLLRWEGIQATREFAKSPSTKTIILGNRTDGLPLLLGDLATSARPNEGAGPRAK